MNPSNSSNPNNPSNPMTPFLRTLPPAGNKIPIPAILRSFKRKNSTEGLKALTNFLGAKQVLFLSSGRAALWLTLKALSSLQPSRHKVIVPAYTCPAVASAVLKAGLQPVLCDINLDDFGYAQSDLEDLIDEDTLAVIVVHLFGFPANTKPVANLCQQNGAFFLEDAAQAFGNELPSTNEKLGLIGDAGFFSFGRGKPVSALHGGLIATTSNIIYDTCLEIYNSIDNSSTSENITYLAQLGCYSVFSNPSLYWIPQGMPFLHLGETIFQPDFPASKGSDIASGIAETLLENFEDDKKSRMEKTQWYNENLPETIAVRRLSSAAYPFLRYPLITKDRAHRDALLKGLNSIGISGALFYPCPLNELDGLKEVLRDNNVYLNAKNLSERLITLPVHEGVKERDMIRIKRVIESILT
jgi:perosamine synthetase